MDKKSGLLSFYPGDFLGQCAGLSFAETGAFFRLLCWQLDHGEIPKTGAEIEAAVGGPITPRVLAMFPFNQNERLKKMVEKKKAWIEKSRLAGKNSSNRRVGDSKWGKNLVKKRWDKTKTNTNQYEPPNTNQYEPNLYEPIRTLLRRGGETDTKKEEDIGGGITVSSRGSYDSFFKGYGGNEVEVDDLVAHD